MAKANCSVDDAKSRLAYDRSAPDLQDLKKSDFKFEIKDFEGSRDIGEFRMMRGGDTVRYHRSEPFEKGALAHKGIDVNKASCIVQLKKKKEIDLEQVFGH